MQHLYDISAKRLYDKKVGENMTNDRKQDLLEELQSTFLKLTEITKAITDEELDSKVPGYNDREMPIRNILYASANHVREHVNHIQKILTTNNSDASNPSEAQTILAQNSEALGRLQGTLIPLKSEDLDLSLEGESIEGVLKHLINTQKNYINYYIKGKK
tara:strand:- start:1111 stop:1590 length:480 start_codon:yes stop_codon:yes gene_type:complete